MSDTPKWHLFDRSKGYRQKRPPIGKVVLCKVFVPGSSYNQYMFVVGYRKNASGCKDSPYFVTPMAEALKARGIDVVAWCDCLPEGMFDGVWDNIGFRIEDRGEP